MRGYITRLIDVTLIILIGFLAVADLDDRSALPLPTGVEKALRTLPADSSASRQLEIRVVADARFELRLSSSTGLGLPLGAVAGADTLRAIVQTLKEQHGLAGASIDALPLVPVQSAVDALDACDLAGLPRDVRFRLEAGGRP